MNVLVFLRNYKRRWVARRLIARYERQSEGRRHEMNDGPDRRALLPEAVSHGDKSGTTVVSNRVDGLIEGHE